MSHVQFLVSIFVVSSCIEGILPICSNHASLTDNMFADQELRYHSIYETSVISPYECADVCLRDARCRSFNFKRKQNSRDVNICEINDIKWEKDHAGLVWPKQGTDIYNVGSEDLRKLILTYNTTKNQSRVLWTEPGLKNNSTSSYLMCQMQWHSVRVIKQGPNVTLVLDDHHAVSSPVAHGASMKGELFLGGYPANRLVGHHAVSAGFKGCLKSFSLDGNSLHFARAADLSEVSMACPLSNSEKDSANSE